MDPTRDLKQLNDWSLQYISDSYIAHDADNVDHDNDDGDDGDVKQSDD